MAAHGALFALIALLHFSGGSASFALQPAEPTSAITGDDSPIRRVITLIEEMRTQAEKDAAADLAAYEKYMCWCKTNEEAKTAAIDEAERRIAQLTALLEQLAALEAQLKTEIAGLAQDIADDQDALATATAIRQKQFAAFQAEEADLKETHILLYQAVQVLSKVQLLQKDSSVDGARARTTLLQLQDKLQRRHADFQSVMKKDLFEVLGSFADSLPRNSFLPKKSAAFVDRRDDPFHDPNLLPWERTDEQKGVAAKPNELFGAAAGAKSYNSRSGRILGILSEMGEETGRDLEEAQKNDFRAEVAYQQLRAAKLEEIRVASEQKKRKEAKLADTIRNAANAKEDREATQEALSADEKFLANMLKGCKNEDEEYNKRRAIRSEEIVAISETISILTADEARGLYRTTITLLQISSKEQDRRAERAFQRIAAVARKHGNWALVSLAVHAQLDAFTKVKKVMDKMLRDLARQQKEEYAKWEECKANIDKTEDDIKVGLQTKEDLDEKHKGLVNLIETLSQEISNLQDEEHDMKVALKAAGELRKDQNEVYQTAIMNQRATTNILNKALARLKMFYSTKGFVQVSDEPKENIPGWAPPPPPKGRAYGKSSGAGPVIQLLMKVIENSEVEEKQLELDEQNSQKLYSEFVSSTTAGIEAHRAAIAEKQTRRSEAKSAKSVVEGDQLANDDQLAKLTELLKAHHLECDYLIKYFDIRQQARAEEMDAITDAKAVLSGASFS